ncbi:hypothetical protein P7C70_g1796, partial [Phenoliferia sp. Uapishka_3]
MGPAGGDHSGPLPLSVRNVNLANHATSTGNNWTAAVRTLDSLDDEELNDAEADMDEDLRRERLHQLGPEMSRVVEDDYEELLSMPIAKALQSRRPSQQSLKTYLPTSPSSTSLRASFLYADSETGPIARSPSVSSRSTSPPPTSSLPRPIKGRSMTSPNLNHSVSKKRPSAEPEAEVVEWEVLQVRKPSPQEKALRPSPKTSNNGRRPVARNPSASTPPRGTTGEGASIKFPPSSSTPAVSSSPGSSPEIRPRTRAQTQNARPTHRQTPSTVSAPRKPVTNNNNAANPARLRAASTTATNKKRANTRYNDDDTEAPLPPWVEPGVQLYRSEGGRLESSGRPDELVLPGIFPSRIFQSFLPSLVLTVPLPVSLSTAVARKLEAERLAREGTQDGLINRYGPDGRPQGSITHAIRSQNQYRSDSGPPIREREAAPREETPPSRYQEQPQQAQLPSPPLTPVSAQSTLSDVANMDRGESNDSTRHFSPASPSSPRTHARPIQKLPDVPSKEAKFLPVDITPPPRISEEKNEDADKAGCCCTIS